MFRGGLSPRIAAVVALVMLSLFYLAFISRLGSPVDFSMDSETEERSTNGMKQQHAGILQSVSQQDPQQFMHAAWNPHGYHDVHKQQFGCGSQPYGLDYQSQIIEECVTGPPPNPTVTAVFVHVGADIATGMHSFYALAQTRRSNPHIRIAWILNKSVLDLEQVKATAACYAVETHAEEDMISPEMSEKIGSFNESFFPSDLSQSAGNPKDFEYRTSVRMLHVLGYMKKFERGDVFHVENDNLVYLDLARYAQVLASCGVYMAVGQRHKTELDLGLFYARTYTPLEALVDYWIRQYTAEKAALGQGFKQTLEGRDTPVNILSLSEAYHSHAANSENQLHIFPASHEGSNNVTACIYQRSGVIVDGGNVAMWSFGDFDTGLPYRNRSAVDLFGATSYKLKWCRQNNRCSAPILHNDQQLLHVGQLHVHSKRLHSLLSSCSLPQVNHSQLFTVEYIDNLAKNLQLRTSMYGQNNLGERIAGYGMLGDSKSWHINGRDRRPTYPFVTGDGFRAMCPWHCGDYTTKELGLCNIKLEFVLDGDCVFIEMIRHEGGVSTGAYIESFFNDVLPKLDKKVVIVTHNGDQSAPDSDIFWRKEKGWPEYYMAVRLTNPQILRWFSANCFWNEWRTETKPEKLTCIPIGIENRYIKKDPKRYIEAMRGRIGHEPSKLVIMGLAFSKTYSIIKPERSHMNSLKNKAFIHKVKQLDWDEWAKKMRQYRFVICPWGHGIDTHRVWEVLLLGSFPVVRSSTLDSIFEGLPVVIVKHWDDVSMQLLNDAWDRFQKRPLQMEKLFSSYWHHQILSAGQLGGV